jgi:hypothetical protein
MAIYGAKEICCWKASAVKNMHGRIIIKTYSEFDRLREARHEGEKIRTGNLTSKLWLDILWGKSGEQTRFGIGGVPVEGLFLDSLNIDLHG